MGWNYFLRWIIFIVYNWINWIYDEMEIFTLNNRCSQ